MLNRVFSLQVCDLLFPTLEMGDLKRRNKIMKSYYGGETVKSGFYFSFRDKDLVDPATDSEILPGGNEVRYVRIPSGLVVLAGPLIGLLYVIFLPLISFVMLLYLIGKQIRIQVQKASSGLLHPASATWRPGFAYFAWRRHPGKRNTEERAVEASEAKSGKIGSELLDQLELEIANRRKEGKQ